MSADDIEQAGRMLMPAFLDAARRANDEMFNGRIKPELEPIKETLTQHGEDIESLKRVHWKQAGAWGAICGVAFILLEALRMKFLKW